MADCNAFNMYDRKDPNLYYGSNHNDERRYQNYRVGCNNKTKNKTKTTDVDEG